LGKRKKLLEIKEIEVLYGEYRAIKNASLRLGKGELVAIIGANGAGKTTIIKSIIGTIKVFKGQIRFMDRDITRLPAWERAEMGISIVPEGRRIFPELNVKQNLIMGAYVLRNKETIQNKFEMVLSLFPILQERMNQLGRSLSGGEQQMLAIGRAMMANPKLMLIDEISMGLMPIVVDRVFKLIQKLHQEGITILLVEQNAKKALAIADRGYLLETGQIVLHDSAQGLRVNPMIQKAYLGG
jgi:branched-chain amino acid transport system ATP-binding protein